MITPSYTAEQIDIVLQESKRLIAVDESHAQAGGKRHATRVSLVAIVEQLLEDYNELRDATNESATAQRAEIEQLRAENARLQKVRRRRHEYDYVGDYGATPGERATKGHCDECAITWNGKPSPCPECGNKKETPNDPTR